MRSTSLPALLGLFFFAGAATASTNSLVPIAAGTWVRDGTACQDAPFAAQFSFDGQAFAGPHASGCRTKVLSHDSDSYRMSTTCTALGDGTPTAKTTEVQRLTIVSPTTVRFSHSKDTAIYHHCP